jgi:hypothetical protein
MNHKLCKRCGAVKPASEFGSNAGRHDGLQVYCKPCWTEYRNSRKAETKASQRRWYATHRDEHLEQKAEYYRENREAIRPKRWKVNRDPDEYARHVADMKARSRVYRAKVFAHYGTSCECCGESNPGFLTIDHINGCTKEERKKQGGGSGLYRWLIANGFPEGFRTLCMSCNLGRASNLGGPRRKYSDTTVANVPAAASQTPASCPLTTSTAVALRCGRSMGTEEGSISGSSRTGFRKGFKLCALIATSAVLGMAESARTRRGAHPSCPSPRRPTMATASSASLPTATVSNRQGSRS